MISRVCMTEEATTMALVSSDASVLDNDENTYHNIKALTGQ